MSELKAAIRERALAEGFDAVGFAPATSSESARAAFRDFLEAGFHGDMGWLAETAERRCDPRALWPEARSVVVLGQNYGPESDPLALLGEPELASVSVYARNRDYHDTVKKRLKRVARWLAAEAGCQVKVFIDTAPVLEKPLAQAGGLGWQGKHSNLLSRDWGNWLFLGEIFTDLALPPDPPEADHCGRCRRCLDACPTDAFPAPYRLDARRCISYLTIEHRGPIPREFRRAIGNRIYGCDDCLAVCPWNKFARTAAEADFRPRAALEAPRLAALAGLDDAAFRQLFSGSPIKRIGLARFLRNVLIAIGNSGAPGLLPSVRARLDDPQPLVRGAAAWALRRLAPEAEATAEARRRLAVESDAEARAEWAGPP
ncbi:epoxyqueuosine reductase [Tistlia consotensis]|uniref:Epoxyqueuosine reductase n=1 Tax=Tistlia consotensis USBA 355 TaxID=560819 RepID=A0A1Y6CEW5_9PROT|nr:tRNA epoxyqueuosine(34) reductase QueG [Tistlia consotensis]SMF60639.1 epoxyqueuosine reductase [Tistlia consotensis USBA 355]SNR93091.1 epoxyqueuosine reductase [Tistlia consotensis]